MRAAEFLGRLYEMGDTDGAIDLAMGYLDDLSVAGDFAEIASVLELCDVDKLASDQLFNLMITSDHVREKLPDRDAFLDRVERRLLVLVGVDHTANLMCGMRGSGPSDTGAARDMLSPFLGKIPR